MLVATSNPRPCGHYGTNKPCTCLSHHISNYQRKLSGPIIDRIDLYVDVDEVKHNTLLHADEHEEPSRTIQKRVIRARTRQHDRYGSYLQTNSILDNRAIKTCPSKPCRRTDACLTSQLYAYLESGTNHC